MSPSTPPTSPSILVDGVNVDGTDLECTITTTADCRRFFTGEPFRASYDVSIEDVPEGVLVIPVLAQVAPVAWALGADVYVPELDERFIGALGTVEDSLRAMYPEFIEGGQLHVGETVDATRTRAVAAADGGAPAGGESALLFTGGVDSTCSYVRHHEEAPTLVSVRGWTITPDESDDGKWDTLRSRVSGFADERGLETAFVESNMLSFLDHPMLLAHYSRYVDGGWYSSVGHGLGLLGLCAPMAHARGVETLYVAATHWDGIDLEWGSRPDIDDHVRYADTRCRHDAYDLTRQERIDAIADYVREDAPDLQLQTCNDRMDGNCGECEKCYRTAVGLRLSRLDPTDHGYPFADEDYSEIRRAMESGEWILGHDERYMWADIRERARETEPSSPAERAFFEWLDRVDLGALVDASGPPLHFRILRAGARNTPNAVYSRLYPVWSGAKKAYRRLGT